MRTPGPASESATHASTTAAPPTAPAPHTLGERWIVAYLTRPQGASDTTWITAIAPLSTSDLVDTLRAADNPVGLSFTSWKVSALETATLKKPIDTPTRHVEALTATVTDGTNSVRRTFLVYAYLDDTVGSYLVGQVDHLDNSQN